MCIQNADFKKIAPWAGFATLGVLLEQYEQAALGITLQTFAVGWILYCEQKEWRRNKRVKKLPRYMLDDIIFWVIPLSRVAIICTSIAKI